MGEFLIPSDACVELLSCQHSVSMASSGYNRVLFSEAASQPVTVLRETPLVRALNTLFRDKTASRMQFVTSSNRLTRLLIEESLALLPTEPVKVETPLALYEGCKLPNEEDICVVSILRAADCMAGEARVLMPACSIGKILIQRDHDTAMPDVKYAKLPPNVAKQHVLLVDPMLATGGSAKEAIKCLVDAGVPQEKIIFVCMVCVQEGIDALQKEYPAVKIVTGQIDPILNEVKYIVPGCGDFGDRYFGTD